MQPTDDNAAAAPAEPKTAVPAVAPQTPPVEIGGPSGLEPTRYGDWEKQGRCIDF